MIDFFRCFFLLDRSRINFLRFRLGGLDRFNLNRLSTPANNCRFDPRFFNGFLFGTKQRRFDSGYSFLFQCAHMTFDVDIQVIELGNQHLVGHVQISGKFVYSELGHSFPQNFSSQPASGRSLATPPGLIVVILLLDPLTIDGRFLLSCGRTLFCVCFSVIRIVTGGCSAVRFGHFRRVFGRLFDIR